MIALALALAVAQPSQPGFNFGQAMEAYRAGQQARQEEDEAQRARQREDEQAQRAEQDSAGRRRDLASRVVELIEQGRCREAYNLAALSGDRAMADRSRGLCQPRGPQR